VEETFAFRGYEIPVRLCLLTGGPDTFDTLARQHLHNVNVACGLRPGQRVLEIGCGIGRDAIPFTDVLGRDGRYIGIDVIADSIQWCTDNISRRHPNSTFVHQDIQDDLHNPSGTVALREVRLPVADRWADLVVLQSVFTHMLQNGVAHYLREIARCARSSGARVRDGLPRRRENPRVGAGDEPDALRPAL
jgi:SAM-dependent methyltransferase